MKKVKETTTILFPREVAYTTMNGLWQYDENDVCINPDLIEVELGEHKGTTIATAQDEYGKWHYGLAWQKNKYESGGHGVTLHKMPFGFYDTQEDAIAAAQKVLDRVMNDNKE